MGRAPYGLSAAPREYRLIMLGQAYHYNSYFAFGWHARPPFSVSFTQCPPCPSPATPPTHARRLCTAPNPLRLNRNTSGQRHLHSWPPQQQRDLPAASSSRSLRGATCAFVSTGRPIMRLYLCLASAGPSKARSSCPSPKVSSLSLSVWVSLIYLRANLWEFEFESKLTKMKRSRACSRLRRWRVGGRRQRCFAMRRLRCGARTPICSRARSASHSAFPCQPHLATSTAHGCVILLSPSPSWKHESTMADWVTPCMCTKHVLFCFPPLVGTPADV
jgi:hypothetical protein